MGIADHRNHALAVDMNSAWSLPDPNDENEDEAQAVAGLAQCNSLLAMSGGKPRKKKRPVLLLDPEEAAKALSQMTLTAAQDFADPERAARSQPALGLSAADESDDTSDSLGLGDNWREWAARGPTPLSTLPSEDPFFVQEREDLTNARNSSARAEEPAQAPGMASKPAKTTNSDDSRSDVVAVVPSIETHRETAALGSAPALAPKDLQPKQLQTPASPGLGNRFVEVPFEEEPIAAPTTAAPRLSIVAEREGNSARRKLQQHAVRGDTGVPSFASLLARLRAAIERITTRR